MTNNQGNVSLRGSEAQDHVAEPPLRLIIAAVALGMMAGAFIGDGPADEQGAAAPAAIVDAE